MADKKTKAENGNEKVEKQRPKITISRAADYTVLYSDTVRLSVNQYDFKLTFSVNETLPNKDVQITEMLTIVLSPQHAKVLAETLAKNVDYYENNVLSLELKENFEELHEKTLREQNIID